MIRAKVNIFKLKYGAHTLFILFGILSFGSLCYNIQHIHTLNKKNRQKSGQSCHQFIEKKNDFCMLNRIKRHAQKCT